MLRTILRWRLLLFGRTLRAQRGVARLGPGFSIVMYLLIALAIASFAGALARTVSRTIPTRVTDLLLLPFAALVFTTLLAGTAVTLNELFVASDIDLLMTAPLSTRLLFALKTLDCSRAAWPASGWAISALVGYGLATGAGSAFYVTAIALVVLLNAGLTLLDISLVLLAAIVIPPKRFRETMLVLSSVAGVAIWLLWISSGSRRLASTDVLDQIGAVNHAIGWTPFGSAALALAAVSVGGWGQALLSAGTLVATDLVLLAAAYLLFERLFLPRWGSTREMSSGRRSRSGSSPARIAPLILAVAVKDWRTVRRDVPYLSAQLPSLIYALIYPIVLIRLPTGDTVVGRWLALAGVPLVALFAASGPALSAVGREGAAFDLIRSSPAQAWRILGGKILAIAVPIGAFAGIAGLALAQLHHAPAVAFAVAALGGAWLGAGCSAIGVAVGALHPAFDADYSRRRQNPTSAGCMLYIVVAALFAAGSMGLVAALVVSALGRAGRFGGAAPLWRWPRWGSASSSPSTGSDGSPRRPNR